MDSVLKAVREELGERIAQVNIVVVNLDKTENHPLGTEYQIRYVPSIFFMNEQNEIVEAFDGGLTKEDVMKSLENLGVK